MEGSSLFVEFIMEGQGEVGHHDRERSRVVKTEPSEYTERSENHVHVDRIRIAPSKENLASGTLVSTRRAAHLPHTCKKNTFNNPSQAMKKVDKQQELLWALSEDGGEDGGEEDEAASTSTDEL